MASEFDQILDDLESRWNHSTEVELAAFLSEHGIVGQNQDSPPETIRLLLEAVQVDLERRWMSRGRLPIPEIAQYLEQFPSLNTAEVRSQLEAFDQRLRQRWPPLELNDTPQLARTSLALGEPPNEEFSPRRSDFRDGQMFGPYRIVRKIGEGGMGAVYQVVQEHLGKPVALKVLSPKLVHDENVLARFRREMKAAGLIEHPNVVRAMDAGEIGGTHFLVTEFVDGTDLAKLVQSNGPVGVAEACRITRQAAEALSAAHTAGLVHRDIKPSNLMLTASGQVKLLDLGLTRLVSESEHLTTELTEAGNTFGTPDYMAPEQWDDAREADSRTDLYALGCTLFFLLVGRAPFATDRYRSAYSKMKAHADAEIPDVSSLREDIPAELAAAIRKLLAKRREDRFQTAAELNLAIETGLLRDAEPRIPKTELAKRQEVGSRRKLLALSVSGFGFLAVAGLMIQGVLNRESPNVVTNSRASNKDTARFDQHRAAAEWVLSFDSRMTRIGIELEDDSMIKVLRPREAVPQEPFAIRFIDVFDAQHLATDDDLDRYVTPIAPSLTGLHIFSSGVTPKSVPVLNRLDRLFEIWLVDTKLSGADCIEVFSSLPFLNSVTVSDKQFTPELVDLLRSRQSIDTVGLYGGNDAQLRQMFKIPQLTRIKFVGHSRADSATWHELPEQLPKLVSLDVQTSNVSDADLAEFSCFQTLSDLNIAETKITDMGMVALWKCPALTSLAVQGTKVTKSGVWWLHEQCPNCRIYWDGGVIEPKAATNAAPQTPPPETKPVAPAPASSALEFDGLDDRVDIPAFKFDWSNPFTWEAVVQVLPDKTRVTDDNSSFADPIFRHDNQNLTTFRILFDRGASTWFVIHRPIAGQPDQFHGVRCGAVGEMHHVAFVFTGQELKMFLDGKPQRVEHYAQLKRQPDNTDLDLKAYGSSSVALGEDVYYAKNVRRWFRGRLNHLRLSEEARYVESTSPDLAPTADSTTAFLYHFDANGGEQLKDLSTHQRHGWIRGPRWVALSSEKSEPQQQPGTAVTTIAATPESIRARQVVHSVVSAGGSVEVQFDSQHGPVLVNRDNLTELPERPFLIRTIVLADATQWPEDQQELLASIHYLDWIRLDQASSPAFDALAKMDVKGAFTHGSDPELRILRNHGLQELSLMGSLGDEDAWKQLTTIPRLDRLLIGSPSHLAVQVLPDCASLRNLTLTFAQSVPDNLLETLTSLRLLTELKVEGPLDDRLLLAVEPLKRLKVLDVSSASKVTENGLRQLVAARPDLIVLHPMLQATEAELATMRFIESNSGALRVNTWNGQPWKADSSEQFVPRELHFQNGRLTDFAQALRDLRFLIAVRCPSTGNPDELIKLFERQANLRFITFEARGLTADGLRELSKQPEMVQIYMHSCPKLSEEGWSPIRDCHRLRKVTFLDGSEIGDAVVDHLAHCEQLDTLAIQNSPHLTATGLLPLRSLRWLGELNVSRSRLDDSAVENFAQLTSLRVLHLDGTRITQDGIDRLRQSLPKCALFWKGTVLLPAVRDVP